MNSTELAEQLGQKKNVVDAAVRSLQENPQDFSEETANKVSQMLSKAPSSFKQLSGGSKPEQPQPKPQLAEGIEAVLKNAIAANTAISEKQILQILSDAKSEGETLGALKAINRFVGVIEGETKTDEELWRLYRKKSNNLLALLLQGNEKSLAEGETIPQAYQQIEEQQLKKPLALNIASAFN